MKTIYKYPIEITDEQVVDMPAGARVLSVQEQHGRMQLWALVDPDEPMMGVQIRVFGTGHPVPDVPGIFLGTCQTNGGSLVWHVFGRNAL